MGSLIQNQISVELKWFMASHFICSCNPSLHHSFHVTFCPHTMLQSECCIVQSSFCESWLRCTALDASNNSLLPKPILIDLINTRVASGYQLRTMSATVCLGYKHYLLITSFHSLWHEPISGVGMITVFILWTVSDTEDES